MISSNMKAVNIQVIRAGNKKGDPVVTDICALQYLPEGKIKYKLSFEHAFALKVQDTLQTDWSSYNLSIGNAGDVISAISLLSVEEISKIRNLPTVEAVSERDDPWMAGWVLGIYRLIRTTIQNYKTSIVERITTQLKAIDQGAAESVDVVDQYMGWVNHRNYNMLVAAYDMFFTRFPFHTFASLRIGTTGTRFRDCAGLMSYGYVLDVLGMSKATDLMDWVFIEGVGNDINDNY
ncbi:unnamed protein product [Arctia plantaginis]|uniref:Rhabdovirus nucleocapsid domain-containing protein n=1 Tax=Arctia plantaginis TaxID=874455 RepID=A0A8S0ZGS3_ARCPL|nr:unnamed protein product [Arctia plantaginis]CAB3231974.1 unnamed protein product [Arctia plantaginis]